MNIQVANRSDTELQRDVMDELTWQPSIDAGHIGVMAWEGVVTLTGHVATHSEKHAAEEAAKRVHGVKGIANEIEVRPSDSHQRDDEHLAAAAVHALEWDAHVPSERLQVTVENGWITLVGTVEHKHQRAAAERAVRHLVGVRGVSNSIEIQPLGALAPRRETADLKAAIEAALRRSALIDASRIQIEIDEHTAILTGDVRSRAEHDEVLRIVWTAREIADVENCITITPWGCGPMEEWGY